MKYHYISSICKQMEEVELNFGPIAFYTLAETLRIHRLGGSREFAEALFTSIILTKSGAMEANHTLWYVFLKEFSPDISHEQMEKTSKILEDLAGHKKAFIWFSFSDEIVTKASEIAPGLIELIKKCKGGDTEIASSILARYVHRLTNGDQ